MFWLCFDQNDVFWFKKSLFWLTPSKKKKPNNLSSDHFLLSSISTRGQQKMIAMMSPFKPSFSLILSPYKKKISLLWLAITLKPKQNKSSFRSLKIAIKEKIVREKRQNPLFFFHLPTQPPFSSSNDHCEPPITLKVPPPNSQQEPLTQVSVFFPSGSLYDVLHGLKWDYNSLGWVNDRRKGWTIVSV